MLLQRTPDTHILPGTWLLNCFFLNPGELAEYKAIKTKMAQDIQLAQIGQKMSISRLSKGLCLTQGLETTPPLPGERREQLAEVTLPNS